MLMLGPIASPVLSRMRLPFAIPLFLCSALLLLAPQARAQGPIANEKVALTGEADPFGGLFPAGLKVFRLGDDGALLFHSLIEHENGLTTTRLYSGTYAGATRRLTDGARATGNRSVRDFLFCGANDSGQLAVMGYVGAARNIYLLTGATLKTLVVEGADAAGDGQFSYLNEPALETKGHVVFTAETTQSGMGLFILDAAATPPVVRKVAAVDEAAPEGGTFTFFDYRVSVATRSDWKIVIFFNAATTDGAGTDSTAFYAAVTGEAGQPAIVRIADGLHTDFLANRAGQALYRDGTALYLAALSGATPIAQPGDPAPAGDTLAKIGEAAINDAGTVVFEATTATAGTSGLYVRTASGTTQLAVQGKRLGNDLLQSFGAPQINQNGLIAFTAEVDRTGQSGVSLYLSDGTTLVRVIGTGDALAGSNIEAATVDGSLVLNPSSLNIHGQIAFSAKLSNGREGLFIATPTSRLRAGGTAVWDDPLAWDFRIVPGPDTPVVASSATNVLVQGPPGTVPRKVRSVQVGGGNGTTTLHLQNGSSLTAPQGVSLLDHGGLSGYATIAGNLTMSSNSRLELQLGDSTRAFYDFLRVTGTATLGGTLIVTKGGSFEPTRGQTFDVLDLTRRVGTFATVSLPALNPLGQMWDTTRLYTTGAITVSGALLFAPENGLFTGIFQGSPTTAVNSGSLLLSLAPNGIVRGSIFYAGRRYFVNTILDVDGSKTVFFGLPRKALQIQVAMTNQGPQLTATVVTESVQESQSISARTNPNFFEGNSLAGHYTIALPPDSAQTDPAFPQGTGYAKVTVTSRGLATMVGVLGDGTPFSVGGPLTPLAPPSGEIAGEFPFYIPAYALKGVVAGKLVLHGSTPDSDAVEGSIRWLKPATSIGRFKSAIDATVTVFGSGFVNPNAPAKILTFTNDQATFHAMGGDVDTLPDKAVVFSTAYQLKSATPEPFVFTFAPGTFGLGSGNFRDAFNIVRTMKGVALQKQNEVVGLLIGTDQTGTFDID
jgi:hypothetical protein